MKIRLNELNELFSTIQQDLRTRSQACELVQTCIDEINSFLDSLQIQSNENEILSLTLIKNLHVGFFTSIPLVYSSNILESIRSIRIKIETFTYD